MRIPDLSEVKDLEVKPEGEYNLRIVNAQDVTSQQTGREGMLFVIHNLDYDDAVPIFHRVWLPMEGDDKHKADTMWRMLKEFVNSLGLPLEGCETENFQGLEFKGMVTLQKNNQSGEDENVLKRVTES